MKPKTILKVLGYVAWFLTCVVFFVYLTFPMDRVKGFIERKASEKLGGNVTIDALDLQGLSAIEVWGLSLETAPSAEAESTTPQSASSAGPGSQAQSPKRLQPVRTTLEFTRLETDLLDYLGDGPKTIHGEIDAFGGTIRGLQVDINGDVISIEIPEISGIQLENVGMVQSALPFPLSGQLGGNVSITWTKTLYESVAKLDIRVDDAVIREPVIKTENYGAFTLTDIQLGTLSLVAKLGEKNEFSALRGMPGPANSKVLFIERLEASSEDIQIVSEERNFIQLRADQPFGMSILSAGLAFHLEDAFFDRTMEKDGVQETPNRFLRTIMNTDRRFKTAEKNGFIGLNCRGVLTKPDCNLARPNVRVGLQRPTGVGAFGTEAEDDGAAPNPDVEPNPNEQLDPQNRPSSMVAPRPNNNPPPRVRPERGAARPPTMPEVQPIRADMPATADDARKRLEELRKQREDRMNQLREERQRLRQINEPGSEELLEPVEGEFEEGEELLDEPGEFIDEEPEDFVDPEGEPEPEGPGELPQEFEEF